MLSKELIAEILSQCKFSIHRPYGGQHVGVDSGVILTHPDYSISITMDEYKTQAENKAAAEAMFQMFLLSENIK